MPNPHRSSRADSRSSSSGSRSDGAGAARERFRTIGGGVKLVYEDEHVLVVDKPTGIPTVPPPKQTVDNVFSLVKTHVRNRKGGRNARAWIIHRLDREASGLLVFAKTEQAFSWLKEDFRAKRVQRTYAAVVEGAFEVSETVGLVQSYLYEGADGYMKSAPTLADVPTGLRSSREEDDDDGAKLAVTHYRVIAQAGGRSLLLLKLDTGRKNQIRVHMASIRRPIAGDRRFGGTTDPIGRVCLHAMELGFRHPASGRLTTFVSELPGRFASLANTSLEHVHEEMTKLRANDSGATESRGGEESKPRPQAGQAKDTAHAQAVAASWNHVAEWYDNLLDERGSDHHEQLVLPGVMRLLNPQRGQHVLDVACGQGQLCRLLGKAGMVTTGVDAAPRLIAAAKRADPRGEYHAADARELRALGLESIFDAASCVLALMNIEPMLPVLLGVHGLLKPGGRFVSVVLHPAFRSPGQTSWEWANTPKSENTKSERDDRSARPGPVRRNPANPRDRRVDKPKQDWSGATQFRRVDGYLSPGQREIVMNPGDVASGKPAITTTTYHRPVQSYVRAFAEAGLLVDGLEEWPSLRLSQPGPRAAEENRARREIPMFLAIRGVKR